MKKLYSNPKKRALIYTCLTVCTSISLTVLGNWDTKQPHFVMKIIILFLFILIDVLHAVYCASQDSKETIMSDLIQKQNSSYKKALSAIIHICQFNSDGLNKCIDDYKKTENIMPTYGTIKELAMIFVVVSIYF